MLICSFLNFVFKGAHFSHRKLSSKTKALLGFFLVWGGGYIYFLISLLNIAARFHGYPRFKVFLEAAIFPDISPFLLSSVLKELWTNLKRFKGFFLVKGALSYSS